MEYNHSRKAGNRGDVWKHSVLVALADAIPISGDSFRWIECHAGAPEHELIAGGEWERGIGEALQRADQESPYFGRATKSVREGRYPAGWVFAAERLAKRFERVEVRLFDTSDDVARQYRSKLKSLPADVTRRFTQGDGFAQVRRGAPANLVFLDPPYANWTRLIYGCRDLLIAGIPFVVWYPLYAHRWPQLLVDATGCESWEVAWAPCGTTTSQTMKGCGMLVSPQLTTVMPKVEGQLVEAAQALSGNLVLRNAAT